MSSNLSIAETLAHLEAKIAYHQEQRELHASQEALHAEQKELHDAEHRRAVERFEAFRAASAAVGELLVDVKPTPPSPAALPPEEVRSGGWRWVSKLMLRVMDGLAPDEVFGAARLIQEIETRWGSQLRHRIEPRSVSSTPPPLVRRGPHPSGPRRKVPLRVAVHEEAPGGGRGGRAPHKPATSSWQGFQAGPRSLIRHSPVR